MKIDFSSIFGREVKIVKSSSSSKLSIFFDKDILDPDYEPTPDYPASNEIWYTGEYYDMKTIIGYYCAFHESHQYEVYNINVLSNEYDDKKKCYVITFDRDVVKLGDIKTHQKGGPDIYDCLPIFRSGELDIEESTVTFECNVTSVFLPSSLGHMHGGSFVDCTLLRDIVYNGTKEQWNNIEKEEYWFDEDTPITAIHCTDGDINLKVTVTIDGEEVSLMKDYTYYDNGLHTLYSQNKYYPDQEEDEYTYLIDTENTYPQEGDIKYTYCNPKAHVSIDNTVLDLDYNDSYESQGYIKLFTQNTYPYRGSSADYAIDTLSTPHDGTYFTTCTEEEGFDSAILTLDNSDVAYITNKRSITYSDISPYRDNLVSAEITNNVNSIGGSTFTSCSKLTSVVIPDGITSIESDTFFNCSNLTSVNIPNIVTSIGSRAFGSCSNLTRIDIPDSVTSIGYGAFRSCSGLTTLNIPSGVTSIKNDICSYCSGLTTLNIPSGVTSINYYAFMHCTSLTSITCNATNPPYLGSMVFYDTNNCPIYVPAESVDAYKAAEGWSEYVDRIQAIV